MTLNFVGERGAAKALVQVTSVASGVGVSEL